MAGSSNFTCSWGIRSSRLTTNNIDRCRSLLDWNSKMERNQKVKNVQDYPCSVYDELSGYLIELSIHWVLPLDPVAIPMHIGY